ncbi:MAG: ribosomal protein S18-alanine N-acetyltransferase [Thauera propionica]|uniref:[Ribosomal protein bS18]-alanine N-acetyltransferase n=1 Tax=Thauera propionica TaxID=2019431 RepID=A0A235F1L8_9RHOO|nr:MULTISPECIES: ribosomal protein S18-alanine N-acetyltransferase [Thauera]MDD3676193.1 ribosomal protein S18-alanine N-acetyltransferase [Thauera propionica]MDI3488737.1 [ribosomal protein S18]-alanine N-acetyltransferase [Thauera sp.]MDY0047078.1 ribosomal protein S18-alanine N-acetyltransferase [Thauera propionica]OYD54565.1 ribosomal-protein-alanine N-acetyltransferase [Thauera propionica]
MNEGAIRHFSPLTPNDLDWVHAQEVDLHPFPWTRGNFADSLTAGHGAWLMRVDNERVGYAVVLKVLDEAHLLNISVARAAQGKGHGRALLEWLQLTAKRNGAGQFFLEVRPSNLAGLALYRSQGFEQIGRRKGYYPAAGGREDAIVMRREL